MQADHEGGIYHLCGVAVPLSIDSIHRVRLMDGLIGFALDDA